MSTGLKPDCTAEQTDYDLSFSSMYPTKMRAQKGEFCCAISVVEFLNYSTCLNVSAVSTCGPAVLEKCTRQLSEPTGRLLQQFYSVYIILNEHND